MIIPGETPDAHIGYGAGGLSYSSSGSVGSGLCSAAGPVLTETRRINKTRIEQLAFNRLDTISKISRSWGLAESAILGSRFECGGDKQKSKKEASHFSAIGFFPIPQSARFPIASCLKR